MAAPIPRCQRSVSTALLVVGTFSCCWLSCSCTVPSPTNDRQAQTAGNAGESAASPAGSPSGPASPGSVAPTGGGPARPAGASGGAAAPGTVAIPAAEKTGDSTAEAPHVSPEAWFYRPRPQVPLGQPGKDGSTLYTNEDLQKFGMPPGPSDDASSTVAAFGEQYQKSQAGEKQNREGLLKLRAEAEQRKRSLEAELDRLKRREYHLRNPLLPAVPLTDEEKSSEKGLDGRSLTEQIEKRRKEIQAEIDKENARIESFTPR